MSNKRIDLTQFEARTKGPWAVIRHEDYPEGEAPENKHLVEISSQSGIDEKDQPHWESLNVAYIDYWVDPLEWDIRQEYSETEGTNREMLDANAKAIAAVPDLIAELKRCYEVMNEVILRAMDAREEEASDIIIHGDEAYVNVDEITYLFSKSDIDSALNSKASE